MTRKQARRSIRAGGEPMLLPFKLTYLSTDDREDSHIEIGGTTVFIETGDLLDAYAAGQDFLDQNVDGG
jgi:hypothetical protein